MSNPERLRRVRYSWQGETWTGLFHGWTVVNGERMAVIEREGGQIVREPGMHALCFLEDVTPGRVDYSWTAHEHPNYRFSLKDCE